MNIHSPSSNCRDWRKGGRSLCFVVVVILLLLLPMPAQQPLQPVDIRPIDGETYYVVNQLTGLQLDVASPAAGERAIQQQRSFSSMSQRWIFSRVSFHHWGNFMGNLWQIRNAANGLCLAATEREESLRTDWVINAPCRERASQIWTLHPTTNGYFTMTNLRTGDRVSLGSDLSAGAWLTEAHRSRTPGQSEQWLVRPAFFRGIDNALLEKQEALRVSAGLVWWKDAGDPEDVLAMLRDHGINMVRVRPSSAPPYVNPSQPNCAGNLCFAETDDQDLDLARRAKNLGLSVQLTLLFDGGRSSSVPADWAGHSLAQLESDIYQYTKAEIMKYRQAGAMPDLVAIGNEVDTGFLGRTGSPTGARFGNFAALQKQAIQAVKDAAADTSAGLAIPAPLTCIHITPAWNLTDFFGLANQNGIPYDAICQSYYPLFHGPLTEAQAGVSNPFHQPVEQDVLNAAANNLGKPIFIIETGEHYENGFLANDPWYPPSVVNQRQFLLDLQGVLKNIPGNLALGMEYWDATGVNIPNGLGGFFNGGSSPDSIYIWNGLTLFNNTDSSGATNTADPRYSELLPGIDAVGGKLDPSLTYKLVLRSHQVLSVLIRDDNAESRLQSIPETTPPGPRQQWIIQSNDDGFFQIRSASLDESGQPLILEDAADGADPNDSLPQVAAPDSSQRQEWDIVSAAHGFFRILNRASGHSLDLHDEHDHDDDGRRNNEWKIIPVGTTRSTFLKLMQGLAGGQHLEVNLADQKTAEKKTLTVHIDCLVCSALGAHAIAIRKSEQGSYQGMP